MGAGESLRYRYIIALLLFLLFVPPLFAQGSYADFERGLRLSGDQKAKVEEIKKKYINEWRSTKHEVVRKRLELRELSGNQPGNTEKIEKLQNEISEIEITRENLYSQYRGEVSRILNDEQREKYNNFCTSERRRMMRPMGLRGYER
jgi:Spy/CpxP family protein refolding chaperone